MVEASYTIRKMILCLNSDRALIKEIIDLRMVEASSTIRKMMCLSSDRASSHTVEMYEW